MSEHHEGPFYTGYRSSSRATFLRLNPTFFTARLRANSIVFRRTPNSGEWRRVKGIGRAAESGQCPAAGRLWTDGLVALSLSFMNGLTIGRTVVHTDPPAAIPHVPAAGT